VKLRDLYTDLWRVAPRIYFPLLLLQGFALLWTLVPAFPGQAVLVSLVTDPLATGTSLAFAAAAYGERRLRWSEALNLGISAWLKLVVTSFLTIAAALGPTGWLFYLVYGWFARAFQGGGGWEVPFGLMILLALPGIYIGLRLFITVPVLFVESPSPLVALKRSWRLQAGYEGAAALAYLPLGFLVLILGLALNLALPKLGFILALRLVGPLGWTLYVVYCVQVLRATE